MKIIIVTLLFLSNTLLANEVQELYSDSVAWRKFISKIENGHRDSIIRALKLLTISDAGTSSELNDALFAALKFEPQLIFSSYKNVCFGRANPLNTYEEAVIELDTIIDVVSKINTKAAKDCVKTLKNSKTYLNKFFEVKTNEL